MGILQNSIRDDGEQCCEEAYNRLLAYRKENHIYPFDDECSSSNNTSNSSNSNSSGLHREFCSYCGQLLSTGSGCLVPYAQIKNKEDNNGKDE